MKSPRSSGVLLHISSLPGQGGVGDLGPEAHRFLHWLADAGQKVWQVLPLGPTGYGDSPYQPFSALAGNPLFVSLETLRQDGLLADADADPGAAPAPQAEADYGAAQRYRLPLLQRALGRLAEPLRAAFRAFCEEEKEWLEDFALFMALKEEQGGAPWTAWPAPLRDRHPEALREAAARLSGRVELHRFIQWQFLRQWQALRAEARRRQVELIGDLPIFLSHDSVDVWSARAQYLLHPDGRLRFQAGVPPDYFSRTGQLWGNPLYDWERMQKDGFSFWQRRFRHASRLFDRVRIDHFRGFAAHWEVPAEAADATGGRWAAGPGAALFETLLGMPGDKAQFLAEDLGVITPDVEELRDRFRIPGMRVLQFSFGSSDPEKVRPYTYRRRLCLYTSTHDNNTLLGWFRGDGEEEGRGRSPEQVREERRNALEYLGLDPAAEAAEDIPGGIHWALVRLALSAVPELVILPVQDLLGLPGAARMNQPGRPQGNWRFRLLPGQLDQATQERLRHLTRVYGR